MKDNFETKMEQLEEIVKKLEDGKLSLDDSIKEFETGMKISSDCSKILEDAEKKISILVNKNDNITEEEFLV